MKKLIWLCVLLFMFSLRVPVAAAEEDYMTDSGEVREADDSEIMEDSGEIEQVDDSGEYMDDSGEVEDVSED